MYETLVEAKVPFPHLMTYFVSGVEFVGSLLTVGFFRAWPAAKDSDQRSGAYARDSGVAIVQILADGRLAILYEIARAINERLV